MRETTILTFRFRFVTPNGWKTPLIPPLGRINRDDVVLGNERIFLSDIYSTEGYEDKVVIILKPFATFSKGLRKYLFKDYTSIVIDVDSYAREVKSILDRRRTALALEEQFNALSRAEQERWFKKINCPNCGAAINLSGLISTRLVYCKYCETLFDKHGHPLPGMEKYKICPQTGYFDRVKNHFQHTYFFTGKRFAFKTKKFYCGDIYAKKIFKLNFKRNFSIIVGIIPMLIERYRYTQGRNISVKELVKATELMEKKDYREAEIIYTALLMRTSNHPGICLNYGLDLLKAGDIPKASVYFHKALLTCANYQPVLDILEKYTSLSEDEKA
jgi:hypothetical protein